MKYFLGIDLGGTKILTAVANEKGKILASSRLDTESQLGLNKVMNNVYRTVDSALERSGIKLSQISCIGVGAPGPIINQSTIIHAPNMPGWKNVNLKKILEKKYRKTVIIENDANAAALAEYYFGAGKGSTNMVYLTVSTGIGGGIIINKKLYTGSFGSAGEIGHITVLPGGNKCGCGNFGCIEAMSSGPSIAKAAGRKSAIEVRIAAEKGSKKDLKAINDAAMYLGIGIAGVNNTLDPDIFVIGGGISNMGSLFFVPVRAWAKKCSMIATRKTLKIVPAKLKNDVGVMGAIALCIK